MLPDPAVRQDFVSGCPRLPMAMLEEIHPTVPGWPTARCGYLQLSEAYEDDAATARSLGWAVSRRLSHHLALLTEPGDVAWELRELIGQFPSR